VARGMLSVRLAKAEKKGMSHENQFIIVGNPASVKPDNSLDSHFSSRFGVSSPLERHRMVSSATLNYMPWIRLLIADGSLMPHQNLNGGGIQKCDCSRGHPGRRHRRQETERVWLGKLSPSFGFSVLL